MRTKQRATCAFLNNASHMLKSSFKSFNSKQKTQREKKDKTLVLPKK